MKTKRDKMVTRAYVRRILRPLRDAGNAMSSVCFNLHQDERVFSDYRVMAKGMQQAWDKAKCKMPAWMVTDKV